MFQAKNICLAERLDSNQTAHLSKPAIPLEVEFISSSEDEKDDSLIKEGLEDIKGGLHEIKEGLLDIKSTLKNITKKRATAPAKKEMSFRVASLLVYTIGVKCRGLDPSVEYAPEQVFSLSENAATKFLKANMNDLIRHTHSHLVRVYPKGTRVDSSNYHPHRYWAGGCQLIALNWQTVGKPWVHFVSFVCSLYSDTGYAMNQAMFQRNGHCGYVLKPDALRNNMDLISKRTQHFLDITVRFFHPRLPPNTYQLPGHFLAASSTPELFRW